MLFQKGNKIRVGKPSWNKGIKTGIIPKTSFRRGQKSWNKGTKGIMKPNQTSFKKGEHKSPNTEFKKGEMGLKQLGKNNSNWKGGKSFEPYGLEFNNDLKEVIRNRDKRICFLCKKTELENKTKLTVHHIDYDKKNNDPKNLISLCKKCHTKTNSTRENWFNYFKEKLFI